MRELSIVATDMIPSLHEHSSLAHVFGQTAIFAFGNGFMHSIIVLEHFLLTPAKRRPIFATNKRRVF
jgi:hypothetical protein